MAIDEVGLLQLGVEPPPGSRRDADRSRALAALSTSLAEAIDDVEGVLDRIVRLIAEWLGDCAVIRLLDVDGDALRLAAIHDRDPASGRLIREAFEAASAENPRFATHRLALRDARPIPLTGESFAAATGAMPDVARAALIGLGVHTALICPLRAGGRVIGTLCLWRRGAAPAHSERDQSFVQELADRAALAIENARLVRSLRDEVAERRRNEDDLRLTAELLRRADEKRRGLVVRLVTAQEEERGRIAMDVHDDSIQAMASIGLRLQVLRRGAGAEVAEELEVVEGDVAAAITRLRGLLIRLDSSTVERVGLGSALAHYAEEVFPESVPRVRIRDQVTERMDGPVPTVLYRIAQEALNNVQKHALATTVVVTVAASENGVKLTIRDDGTGFDVGEVTADAVPGHIGMRSMRDRARVAGGWLRVESTTGRGTTVRCWLPAIAGEGDEPST